MKCRYHSGHYIQESDNCSDAFTRMCKQVIVFGTESLLDHMLRIYFLTGFAMPRANNVLAMSQMLSSGS